MKQYNLTFQGYTWDEYFYMIANKPGILVAYRGGLDNEGAVRLDEIIYVDEADELGALYESKQFAEVRKNISNKDRLFFSYAEMKNEGRSDVTSWLKHALLLKSSRKGELPKLDCNFKGACALFPIQ